MPRPKRPYLYVAGPYTNPDPVLNTHRAARVGIAIYETTSYVPFVPHLSLLWHAIEPRPVDFWYEIDLDQMAHCQAIVRLPGASSGADREVLEAAKLGLTRVDYADLPAICHELWGVIPQPEQED